MDTENKIEQCLRNAPKPQTPEDLLGKLKTDLSAHDIKTPRPALRRWLAPSGQAVSFYRLAALVAIATMILLPLTYAGGKIIQTYIFTEGPKVEVIENEDGSVTKTGSISVTVGSEDASSKEEVEAAREEIAELRKAGKYEKTLLREWEEKGMRFSLYKVSYTLSSGKIITVNAVEAGSISN